MTTGPTVAGNLIESESYLVDSNKLFLTGALYEAMGSYQLPFLLAGCPPILCGLIMFLIFRVKNHEAVKSLNCGETRSPEMIKYVTNDVNANGNSCPFNPEHPSDGT